MQFDDLHRLAVEATAAYQQATVRRELPVVERALTLAEALFAHVPAENPGPRAVAAQLTSALLLLRAEAGGGTGAQDGFHRAQDDLDRALDHAESAVRLREQATDAPNLPPLAQFLAHTAEVRRARLRLTGDIRELDGAIDAVRSAVRRLEDGRPERVTLLTNACGFLLDRHLLTGSPADLDEAVRVGRDAVAAAGPSHEMYAGACNNLALALRNHYERQGNRTDLDEAVAHARTGAEAAAEMSVRAMCLSTLGAALILQYEHGGDRQALDESIAAGWTALDTMGLSSTAAAMDPDGADSPDSSMDDVPAAVPVLVNLANALIRRHERTGDLRDLDECIAAAREALRRSHPRDANHPQCLDQLNRGLQMRFQRTGAAEDLSEAVDAGRKALRRCPDRHPARGTVLNNHTRALRLRFEHSGDAADLNEAIATIRRALRTVPPGDTAHALCQAQLSTLAILRHRFASDSVDLDTAVAAGAEALATAAPDDPCRGMYLCNVGIAHQERFTRHGDPADLDAAVTAGLRAVLATPPDHPLYTTCQQNLGNTLLTRWVWRVEHGDGRGERRSGPVRSARTPLRRRTADLADLHDAITAHRAALAAAQSGTERAMASGNLGTALRRRYQHRGRARDAREAEAHLRAAVSAGPDGSPVHGRHLSALAELLNARHRRTGDRAVATEAIALWRQAARLPQAAVADRIGAAVSWAELAIRLGQDWARAMEGMATAVDLVPLLAWRGLDRTERERLLASCAGLAQDGAAAALAAGFPEQAVELLERGRSVLWSQLLEQHTELDALRAAAPALAARLDQVRSALDAPNGTGAAAAWPTAPPLTGSAGAGTPPPGAPYRPVWLEHHDAADRRTAPAQEWDELIEEVRRLPGFENFLRRPRLRELQSALPGPVVLVNVSTLRCDALIVTRDAVRVVPLPDLTAQDAHTRAVRLLTAIHETDRAVGGAADMAARMAAHMAARMHREQTLLDTLEWLWETVAAPVLAALRLTSPTPSHGPWPRLWWCPTGPLALLPVHAAGRPADPGSDRPRPGDSVLDRVVSSYTPTLRSLATASSRADVGRRSQGGRGTGLLAVAVAEAPGLPSLHGVRHEAETVTRLFPRQFHTLLDGPNATRDAVRCGLARHAWAHIACHGSQDLAAPSRAGLHLHDGLLTVAELAAVRPEGSRESGELVYLSACDTAMGGADVPDEAITLAHALQFSGYRQVVATLWSIEDTVAMEAAEDFYTRMAHTADQAPTPAAQALHHSVRSLRAQMPHAPGQWASYVHVGA
ncbi:CHAT domain-containing protein [Streptomyces sp. NPDC020951]|uniref:CHAT domain-containing protein n=1 Tax=Streptomyces sp. NPDC020951 TaxID=3365104 RepID=UPI0037A273E8